MFVGSESEGRDVEGIKGGCEFDAAIGSISKEGVVNVSSPSRTGSQQWNGTSGLRAKDNTVLFNAEKFTPPPLGVWRDYIIHSVHGTALGLFYPPRGLKIMLGCII